MSFAINPKDPALNYVVVNGVRSPGRAQLTGVAAPYKYDVQEHRDTAIQFQHPGEPLVTILVGSLDGPTGGRRADVAA